MKMTISFPGNLKVKTEFKGFSVLTDQPEAAGGDNEAPAPFDYFLASIGSCAGFYVLKFMEQREMDTRDVSLELTTERDEEAKRLAKINIAVNLPKDFPEKYKKAIISSVNLCAVKKHIHEPPDFHTEVIIGGKTVIEEDS